uniref:UBX domain-containing protein n=1 Tax=Panagrellus redivivus TaxID=6233 RepID=A0A7E4V4G7_PANRE
MEGKVQRLLILWVFANFHKDANEAGFLRPSFAVANDNGVRFIPDDGSALDFVRQLRDPLPDNDTVPVAEDSRDEEPVNTEDLNETKR